MDGQGNPEDAVLEKDLYAADETGIQKGIGVKECVYASAGASAVTTKISLSYQQYVLMGLTSYQSPSTRVMAFKLSGARRTL